MKNSSTYGYIHELATLTKFSRIDLKHAIEETGIHLGESSFKVLLQKLLNEGDPTYLLTVAIKTEGVISSGRTLGSPSSTERTG